MLYIYQTYIYIYIYLMYIYMYIIYIYVFYIYMYIIYIWSRPPSLQGAWRRALASRLDQLKRLPGNHTTFTHTANSQSVHRITLYLSWALTACVVCAQYSCYIHIGFSPKQKHWHKIKGNELSTTLCRTQLRVRVLARKLVYMLANQQKLIERVKHTGC